MKCHVLLIRCARTRCCIIFLIFGFIFLIGRLYQYRRYQLMSAIFRASDYELMQSLNPNLSNSKHFIPGMFLKNVLPRNESYCRFRFGLPDMLEINESDVDFTPELGEDSDYRVIYNVLGSNYNVSDKKNNVTFCTHATPEFFYYVVEVLQRWEGPVSIATFVPSTDASLILCLAERLCSCLPDMARVSLHFIFPLSHPPRLIACPSTLSDQAGCGMPKPLANKSLQTFRNSEAMTYPVNVARNVARMQSQTTFTLVADVELFPSKNLVGNFLKMVDKLKQKSENGLNDFASRIVYVLPVFEVGANEAVPSVKSKLLEMYSQNQAFYFHRWVCSHCQRFPGLQRWLLKKSSSMDESIKPFIVVRREFPFHRWEPVFIGTNSEPFYSEMLTWEGQQDKMTQMHEMCLMKYHFVILDGAFLVHAPGVKRKADVLRDSWRNDQQKKNSALYERIMKSINKKLKENSRCRIH
ncbi:hypothetical protein GE061_006071 [Apolygus lucorum]|uniref:N-acetyllactosaminide beta-1,3-N-acetylglucosaminyltransferase n=1 Tax=Apolygus lucorum TaxID=248454 RepID=A0A8S9WSY6_APOLU|nr:hypothetical protein GE061_006071 [Apolygus lucorum]